MHAYKKRAYFVHTAYSEHLALQTACYSHFSGTSSGNHPLCHVIQQ